MASKRYFKDWCMDNDIHPETGRRRKERAILRIMLHFGSNASQHNEIDVSALLPDTPVSGDKYVNIAEGVTAWAANNNRPMAHDFDTALDNFDWARKRNEQRRQREAKRRKEQQAA
jgi:hypothetical protein